MSAVIDFLAAHWPWLLLIVAIYGSMVVFVCLEVAAAPLFDSHGLPVDPQFDADVDQAITNVTTHHLTGGAR